MGPRRTWSTGASRRSPQKPWPEAMRMGRLGWLTGVSSRRRRGEPTDGRHRARRDDARIRRGTSRYLQSPERTQVRARVVPRDAQREREHLTGLLGEDDGVHEAARGGEARIELALVVGAHGIDAGLELLIRLPALLLQLLELWAEQRVHRA